MGLSNNITAILNFLALLCSIPIIGAGIWLASKPDNECIHFFRWPVVLIGVLILLVSLAGFIGAYWNRQGLLAFYLFCMALLIGLLLVLLVFTFVVIRPDGSYTVMGRGFKEYRLDGFSSWLKSHLTNSRNWPKIRTCLAESDVCPKLNQQYFAADQFFAADISPLQVSALISTSNYIGVLSPSGFFVGISCSDSWFRVEKNSLAFWKKKIYFYINQDFLIHVFGFFEPQSSALSRRFKL